MKTLLISVLMMVWSCGIYGQHVIGFDGVDEMGVKVLADEEEVWGVVERLKRGENVLLDGRKVYDFSGIFSIPVRSVFDLNGAVVHCGERPEVSSVSGPFVFNLYRTGVICNSGNGESYMVGCNGSWFPDTVGNFLQGINAIEGGGVISDINFSNWDRMAIRCSGRIPYVDTLYVVNCGFYNTMRNGQGYGGVWNQDGNVYVDGGRSEWCRHVFDGSGKWYWYSINYFTFGPNGYYPVNMHDAVALTGGKGMELRECDFLDEVNPISLIPPYVVGAKILIEGCNFMMSEAAAGWWQDKPGLFGVRDARLECRDNTFGGSGFLPGPAIVGPDTVRVGVEGRYRVYGFSDSYRWMHIRMVGQELVHVAKNAGVGVMSVRGDDGQWTRMSNKTVVDTEPGDWFGFKICGEKMKVEVYRNDTLIEVLREKGYDWSEYFFRGLGFYKLRVHAPSMVFIDDWAEPGFVATFENVLGVKMKQVGVHNMDRPTYPFTGLRSLRVRTKGTGYVDLYRSN